MEQNKRIFVWDLFVRVFHWSLAVSFLLAWASAEEIWSLHLQSGYFILVLIGLRIIWGLIGSTYARFSNFIYSPAHTMDYLRSMVSGKPGLYIGHNPAGGWMIVFLLTGLLLTGLTGWQTELNPESVWEELHEAAANLTLLLVFIHIASVVVASKLHNENLLKAMINGFKPKGDEHV